MRRSSPRSSATSRADTARFPDEPAGRALFWDPTVLAFGASSGVLSVLLGARRRIEAEGNELNVAVAIERERLEAILDSAHIGIGVLDSERVEAR